VSGKGGGMTRVPVFCGEKSVWMFREERPGDDTPMAYKVYGIYVSRTGIDPLRMFASRAVLAAAAEKYVRRLSGG